MIKRGSIAWIVITAIEAAFLITIGVLFMVWSGNEDFQQTAVRIFGIITIIGASIGIVLHIAKGFARKDLSVIRSEGGTALTYAAELAMGIILCYIANHYNTTVVDGTTIIGGKMVFGYAGLFMGIVILTAGVLFIINSTYALVKKTNAITRGVFGLFMGIIAILGGILCLVYLNPSKGENVIQFFLVLASISMLFVGGILAISCIVVPILNRRASKQAKKQEEQAIDAQVEEKPSETSEDKKEE